MNYTPGPAALHNFVFADAETLHYSVKSDAALRETAPSLHSRPHAADNMVYHYVSHDAVVMCWLPGVDVSVPARCIVGSIVEADAYVFELAVPHFFKSFFWNEFFVKAENTMHFVIVEEGSFDAAVKVSLAHNHFGFWMVV